MAESNFLNKFFSKFLNKIGKKGKRIMIFALVILMLIVSIAPMFWSTTKGVFDKVGDFFGDVLDNIKLSGKNLEIDQDYLSEAKKKLKAKGINPKTLGLAGHEEYLERFLEAEIVTNYPYLGGDGLQGAVYFERAKIDGTTTQLKYMEYQEFYNKKNNGDADLGDYFTIDTSDWTVHVIKSTSNSEESGTIEKINYKNMVSKFSMPFEFPISLAMISQNPQFVLAVVNLVKESKIVITIAENKITTTTTTTHKYDEEIHKTWTDENGNPHEEITSTPNKQEVSENVEVTYTTNVFLSRASTWILNEITNLKYEEKTEESDPQVTELQSTTKTVTNNGVTTTTNKTNVSDSVVVKNDYLSWVRGKTEVIDKATNFTNLILRDSAILGGGGLVEIAKRCHDAVADAGFTYGPTSGGIPVDVNVDSKIDCSGYISWVLYEAGYTEMEGGQHTTSNGSLGAFGQSKGWEIIENVDELQPGDICFYRGSINGGDPGHVNICVGKEGDSFIFYDCGSTNSIQAKDPITYNMGEFGYAFRPNDEIVAALNPDNMEDLEEKIKNYINGIDQGKYSVSVKNLDRNSDEININSEKVKSDGLTKLYIMESAYNQVKKGKLNEEDISANVERMIVADDNNAANLLIKTIGEDDFDKGKDIINKYIRDNGYNSTKIGGEFSTEENANGNDDTYTSVKDVSKLLKKIYDKRCVNREYSEKMMNILKGQLKIDMIPSTLTSAEIANKTGEQVGIVQDAAIISTENANYIVVISAKDVENKDNAKNNIREIANIVNNYFVENGTIHDNSDNFEKDDEIKYIMNGRRVCYEMPKGGYECPLNNLVEGREMMFRLLASDDKTQSHERLMRYILYLLTGNDYGVTEFDFNDFLNGSFSNVGGIYGNTIQEKVWFAVLGAGYSKEAAAGVLGNIQAESGFDPAVIEGGSGIGFGLCQWSFGRRTQIEAYAASKGASPNDVNIQIEFLIGEITPGGGANGYASYQLMTYNGYSADDWINATTPEAAAEAFCWSFERPGVPRMSVRTEAARNYYEQFKNMKKPSESEDSKNATEMQNKIVEIASSGDTLGNVGGYCQAWVADVYEKAGQPRISSCCASTAADKWVVSQDKNNIPLGACVYGHAYIRSDGSQTQCGGREAGHVGIYIGNGQVASNVGGIQIESLDSWTSTYGWKGWGWNGGTDYSK